MRSAIVGLPAVALLVVAVVPGQTPGRRSSVAVVRTSPTRFVSGSAPTAILLSPATFPKLGPLASRHEREPPMNLRSSFRLVGLLSALSLVAVSAACDGDSKKAEPVKADVVAKAEPPKPEPAKVEPTPEVKAADTAAGEVKAADTAAGDVKAADTAGDTKAADTAGDTKATDTKATDTKATDTKVTEKKPPVEKAPTIDGKPLYDSKCKVCHAADGKGTEAMKKNDIPDMSDKGWQGKHSKAVVSKAITNGIDGTKMKSFKDKLKPEEIEAVAAYVKKLK